MPFQNAHANTQFIHFICIGLLEDRHSILNAVRHCVTWNSTFKVEGTIQPQSPGHSVVVRFVWIRKTLAKYSLPLFSIRHPVSLAFGSHLVIVWVPFQRDTGGCQCIWHADQVTAPEQSSNTKCNNMIVKLAHVHTREVLTFCISFPGPIHFFLCLQFLPIQYHRLMGFLRRFSGLIQNREVMSAVCCLLWVTGCWKEMLYCARQKLGGNLPIYLIKK